MIDLGTERMEGQGAWFESGEMQVNYLYGLDDLCKQFLNNTMTVLELGTNDGISACLFSFYVSKVVTIDKQGLTDRLKKVLIKRPNIAFKMISFDDFFAMNDMKFDFVYIDGCHDFDSVMTDIENALTVLKPGGLIGGHDFNETTPDVIGAVTVKFKEREIHLFKDSSWLVQLD